MADPNGSASTANQSDVHAGAQQRRHSVIRRALFLTMATVALVTFVAGLGDVRKRDWAMSQCRWYGDVLSKRLADQGDWPIDLQVDPSLQNTKASPAEMYKFKWLTPDEARRLADTNQSILVAWTQVVPQTVWPDGRGCVVYKGNNFDVIWLSEQKFNKRKTTQQAK